MKIVNYFSDKDHFALFQYRWFLLNSNQLAHFLFGLFSSFVLLFFFFFQFVYFFRPQTKTSQQTEKKSVQCSKVIDWHLGRWNCNSQVCETIMPILTQIICCSLSGRNLNQFPNQPSQKGNAPLFCGQLVMLECAYCHSLLLGPMRCRFSTTAVLR